MEHINPKTGEIIDHVEDLEDDGVDASDWSNGLPMSPIVRILHDKKTQHVHVTVNHREFIGSTDFGNLKLRGSRILTPTRAAALIIALRTAMTARWPGLFDGPTATFYANCLDEAIKA